MSTPVFLKPWFIRRWPPKKCFSLMSLYMLHKWWVDITTLQNILKMMGWSRLTDWQKRTLTRKGEDLGIRNRCFTRKDGIQWSWYEITTERCILGLRKSFFSIWLQGMSSMRIPFASVDELMAKTFQDFKRWFTRSLSHWKNWDIGHQFDSWVVRHHL